jgi:transcriptional regulator with XRE-family HTH domain
MIGGGCMTGTQCNDIDVRVGRRVRMTRAFRDLTGSEVAGRLGLSPRDYDDLEYGRRRFSAAQLAELSRLFEVNAAIFFADVKALQPGKIHGPSALLLYSANDNGGRRSSRST